MGLEACGEWAERLLKVNRGSVDNRGDGRGAKKFLKVLPWRAETSERCTNRWVPIRHELG